MARRRRPKPQARSAVCEERVNPLAFPNKGGCAAKMGRHGGHPSSSFSKGATASIHRFSRKLSHYSNE